MPTSATTVTRVSCASDSSGFPAAVGVVIDTGGHLLSYMQMVDGRFRVSRGRSAAILAILTAVCIVAAAGTAVNARDVPHQAGVTRHDEESLRSRVSQWWTARQERDHQAMYQLFEPGYRDATPFAKFLQESAVRSRYDITSHTVVRIEARENDRVVVFLEIGTAFPQFGGPHKTTIEEPWVRVEAVWFKVHQPYKPPFPDKPPK
jgi:hypothetical protein